MNPSESTSTSVSQAASDKASDALASIDKVLGLSRSELLDAPRALLLLRLCRYAQAYRPEVLQRYWVQLRKGHRSLPSEHAEAFKGLRATLEPAEPASLSTFAREIIETVQAAIGIVASNREEACRTFLACEDRLRKRWWPFGKSPAWTALVQAWAETDRATALRLIRHVSPGVQQNILTRMNGQLPLTPTEWDQVHERGGASAKSALTTMLQEILDREDQMLQLSTKLAHVVRDRLLSEIHVTAPTEDQARKIEQEREQALRRYFRLVSAMLKVAPEVAESLMESLVMTTATTSRFGKKWPDRFTALRQQLVHFWVAFPELREAVMTFLLNKMPRHLRDFALSQWYALLPASEQDVASAWQSLEQSASDRIACEAWFLVTLVQRGLGGGAMALARSSPRSQQLLPRLRRAWLCENPQTAASAMTAEHLQGDIIGQFLYLTSTADRVQFLRQHTRNGTVSLPQEMWTRPDIGSLSNYAKQTLVSFYNGDEPVEHQFQEYVRTHGYSQYDYRNLDMYLLGALVAWDNDNSAEVGTLLSTMWKSMNPKDASIDLPTSTALLRLDLLRNVIFERCQTVFAARPTSLQELFVKWIQRELVDKTIAWYEGNTMYQFSLKDTVPFLSCVLSAQKVGQFSTHRCEAILTYALRAYTANEELMTAAAQLFTADKGLSALQPPHRLENRLHLKAWQLGVVQAASREILTAVLADRPQESTC